MGKTNRTYDLKTKRKAVDLYLKEEMGYKTIAKELEIDVAIIYRWVKHFQAEGLKGLEEKRGKAKGVGKGKPTTQPETTETKLKRLEAENALLKKFLGK
ncbi:transposase [Bacillus endophyticus]|uniref:helix-turn-helix domain-containing protein n=1 Tax=Priestia endophytica TaxID=135735 RepID=UPI0018CEB8D9|nr:helix-turn-helix domain-containing protein [Priestia endophytica]MBG9812440.1 transposase [Priestia endophytica]